MCCAPASSSGAVSTRHVVQEHRHFGEFKVPGLRQVARTAPYMHDGQLATLEAVVQHYSELNLERLHADGEQVLRPLRLSPQEAQDLVAFLRSLTAPVSKRSASRLMMPQLSQPIMNHSLIQRNMLQAGLFIG